MSETVANVGLTPSSPWPRRLASDTWLAERAAQGDRRAFAAIFARHHQAIYRYCRSILRDPEDAADALQSTMAAALRGLEGETREIALKPWLYRIAHNESLSMLRSRRPALPLDAEQGPSAPGPEVELLRSERLRQVVGDVQALPDRQRGALVMRELSGLEYAEIAAAFGIAEGAARQAVHEAREMLHELEQGRAMRCADVRALISAGDRRRLRGRQIRSHLRSCSGCRDFEAMIPARRAALAAAAPPLAAPIAASLLHGLIGGAQAGAAGAAGATASTAGAAGAASATGAAGVTGAGAAVSTAGGGGSVSAAGGSAIAAGSAGSAGAAMTATVAGTSGVVAKAATVLAVGASLAGGALVAEREPEFDAVRAKPSTREPASRPQDPPAPRSAAPSRAAVESAGQPARRGGTEAEGAAARGGTRRQPTSRGRRAADASGGRSTPAAERRGRPIREKAAKAPQRAATPSAAGQRPATPSATGQRSATPSAAAPRRATAAPPKSRNEARSHPALPPRTTAETPKTSQQPAAAGGRPELAPAPAESARR